MSKESEMRAAPRKAYSRTIGFELRREEKDSWKHIQGEGQGLDITSSGLGFVTDFQCQAGEVLRLNLPVEPPDIAIPVFSEVRWSIPEGVRYRVGLQFLS